jgi:hypothetical protein
MPNVGGNSNGGWQAPNRENPVEGEDAQTAAARQQSKNRCRPVSSRVHAAQMAEGAQFLKKRLALVLSLSMSAR